MARDLLHGVAAELLEERIRQHEGHHGLSHNSPRGHGTHIATLDGCGRVGQCVDVHRPQRLHESGDGLHESGDAQLLAVRDAAFKAAAEGPLKGVLQYSDEPTVSIDYNGNPHSSIFDSTTTAVIDGNFVKVFSWYDNEMGFSNRMVDVANYLVK